MCLAIYKPVGEYLPEDHLENGFDMNSDGAGFAYRNGDNIVVEKGFFRFESFIKAWRRVSNKQALIHFRWATSGKKDISNCHPFMFNKNKYVMIHNGVLDHQTSELKSDTAHFVEDILEPMSKTYGFNPKTKGILEKHIGGGNKIVIMSRDGKVHFLNESAGHWKDGIWYSNDSYEESYFKWCSSSSTITAYDANIDDTYEYEKYGTDNWWNQKWQEKLIECDFCGNNYAKGDVTMYKNMTLCGGCENQFSYEPERVTKENISYEPKNPLV